MTYIEISKCAICRQLKAVDSGQELITFKQLTTPAAAFPLELRVARRVSPSNGGPSTATQIGVFPVVAFVVVRFEGRESLEPIFLDVYGSGALTFPTLFQVSQHDHDKLMMVVHSFAAFRCDGL